MTSAPVDETAVLDVVTLCVGRPAAAVDVAVGAVVADVAVGAVVADVAAGSVGAAADAVLLVTVEYGGGAGMTPGIIKPAGGMNCGIRDCCVVATGGQNGGIMAAAGIPGNATALPD